MDSKPDKTKTFSETFKGKSRQEVCDKIAMAYIQHQAIRIANHVVEIGIRDSVQYEYLFGMQDGFSLALELILGGDLNLQEIRIEEKP